jgi:cysteine desulfurase family protein (TIGR01976 family)
LKTAPLDPLLLRKQFRALKMRLDGHPAIFFDNPGGTQVPDIVPRWVSHYYRSENANVGGAFETSRRTDITVERARTDMANFLNASGPETIVFGANMTTLTFHLARSLGDTIRPGDEIVVTDLDHDANVTPWTDLQAQGAILKTVSIHTPDCSLDMAAMQEALTERTRLVAITHASNAVGTIPNVAAVTRMAHDVGAWVFVDAVQYAPHAPIDVRELDCDFLVCSAYKFFGPHLGILYGKPEALQRLKPHRVRPAKETIPHCWETGTLNHEGLSGLTGAIRYLEQIGGRYGGHYAPDYAAHNFSLKRLALKTGMRAIQAYEQTLSRRLLEGLHSLGDITLYGITDLSRPGERVPTFAFTWPRLSPRATTEYLANKGICCWSGNYYALRLMERLGLESEGGAVRIGLAHYNTADEIDTLLGVLSEVAK